MKTILTFIIALNIATVVRGQNMSAPKPNHKDSIQLSFVWKEFKNSLTTKNIQELHKLSLKHVYCDLFEPMDATKPARDPYIHIDTFLKQFFRQMHNSKLWLVVKTKKYHMGVEHEENPRPPNKTSIERTLKIYEIWYVTWEPNELAKGHEGQTHAFQFIKVHNRFKFYGMTSVP
ncbi:MAG: hypothetical protein ACXVB0_15650 [Mucilaginibacter sp.]